VRSMRPSRDPHDEGNALAVDRRAPGLQARPPISGGDGRGTESGPRMIKYADAEAVNGLYCKSASFKNG